MGNQGGMVKFDSSWGFLLINLVFYSSTFLASKYINLEIIQIQ